MLCSRSFTAAKRSAVFLVTIALATLNGCGGGGGGSNSGAGSGNGGAVSASDYNGPATATYNLTISSNVLAAIAGAKVKFFDESGAALLSGVAVSANSSGKISSSVSSPTSYVIASVSASGYANQVSRIKVPKDASAVAQVITLSPVGLTVPYSAEARIAPAGVDGAAINTSGAIFCASGTGVGNSSCTPAQPATVDFTILNPAQDPQSFPGSIDLGGTGGIMVSNGMLDLVFRDALGNPMQLNAPTTVTIDIPLYSLLDPVKNTVLGIGDSVPFFSLDETSGLWAQDVGVSASVVSCVGSPTSLCARGAVSHFSWWNVDFAVSSVSKPIRVINSDTQQVFDAVEIDSIRLSADFTTAVPASSRYSSSRAFRQTAINATDTIGLGVDFDAEFVVEVTFADGTVAAKPFTMDWATMNAATELVFALSKTSVHREIKLSAWSSELSEYNSRIYFQTKSFGIASNDLSFKVNGIAGGDASQGTVTCYHPGYCYYDKGTTIGAVSVRAESTSQPSVFDALQLTVRGAPKLGLKREYSYRSTKYEYFSDWGLYLYRSKFANTVPLPSGKVGYSSSYDWNRNGVIDWSTSEELVLDKAGLHSLSDYNLGIRCETASAGVCPLSEQFLALPIGASSLPTYNASNRYYLTATKKTDSNIKTELRLYYWNY